MSVVMLQSGDSKLRIHPEGGRIEHLILNGVSVLGTFERIDGKKGNTHICIPNFGTEGVLPYGLPAHGPGRDGVWRVIEKTDMSVSFAYDMPETGTYPTTLALVQRCDLQPTEFRHVVSVINTGTKDAPVNCALHYYWDASEGWEQAAVNGQSIASFVRQDSAIDLATDIPVSIPGKPRIHMKTKGFQRVQLWTGRKEHEGSLVYDDTYVCIEPVAGTREYFGSEASILRASTNREYAVTLSI